MAVTTQESRLPDHGVHQAVLDLRQPNNATNLVYLALDYFCIAALMGAAVGFAEYRHTWGLNRAWVVAVFGLAMTLIGGLQHRLAGLAHEASHYSLMRNRFLNDLVADLFCMFPLFGTIHFYRLFHLAHHQYTNDPELDPDLANLGPGKRVDDFPMSRLRTIITLYFRALVLPLSFLRYQTEYVYINTLGKGNNVYMRRLPDGDSHTRGLRVGTMLGIAFLVGFNAWMWRLNAWGLNSWLVPSTLIAIVVANLGVWLLPGRWMFQAPLRQPYSPRFASMLRMTFYLVIMLGISSLRAWTSGRSAIYPIVLWYVPLMTSFMFFMLLRDVYQHTNADEGRLTNSRVFFCDPLTSWAVLVHGQGLHVPHHLYPSVPHYRLDELHRVLRETNRDYAEQVVECHGTFRNAAGKPTVLDVLTGPRPVAEPRSSVVEAG